MNGGHVENSLGYDIIFINKNFIKLDHQVESYDPVTGNLVAWVRLPVLSSTSDTKILMLYGNPLVSADPSTKDTWSSEYVQVMHLDGNFLDATQYLNSGNNAGTSDVAGKILSGRSFNG